MPKVEILMTTYNGQEFVAQQIDSILSQTFTDFNLVISDDHSTDKTFDILESYQKSYPEKIRVQQPVHRYGNARDHFFALLKESKADYIFFCDQDDVWFNWKMEKMVHLMEEAETSYGTMTPLLVFSDQTPTDSNLVPLSDSLMKYQKQNPEIKGFRQLLFRNVVTGGAMAFNRALANKSLECTDLSSTNMHDYWLALVCSKFGRCVYLDKSTSYYRQHSNNSVGAHHVGSLSHIMNKLTHLGSVKNEYAKTKRQARIFLDTYSNELDKEEKDFLVSYSKPHSGALFYIRNREYITGIYRLMARILVWG